MRTAIISICIFVLIIILVVFSYNYTDNITSRLVASLEENEKYVEKNQWDKVENETEHFKIIWDKNSDFIKMFYDHESPDIIDQEIIELQNIVENHNFVDFKASAETLKYMVLSLKENQEISFFNLF